jgi:hypothetical protein
MNLTYLRIGTERTRATSALRMFFALALGVGLAGVTQPINAQVTLTDGDWSAAHVMLTNTPEAAFMARVGDIDNLGFGWPTGFDPFSGASTPPHGFPFSPDPADPDGTDRIMVVSSYVGSPPCGQDGYTSTTSRPANSVRPIVLPFALPAVAISNAVLQVFVDDFQAKVWCANYQVTINGRRAPFLEVIINALDQTGPIGKLLTVALSADFLNEVGTGSLALQFDDPTTGAGDGYAIDFVKLLVNETSLKAGNISGHVRDAQSNLPISGAEVVAFGITNVTDANGLYTLTNVPAGLAFVQAFAGGYSSTNQFADVTTGQTTTGVDFSLQPASLTLAVASAVQLSFFGRSGLNYLLQYSSDFAIWTDDASITGTGTEVVLWRLVDSAHRFWRVKQQ